MDLLFKATNTGGFPATVDHTTFRAHYSAINANTAWATLEPSVRRATRDHLIKHIGIELYEDLAALFNEGSEELEEDQAEFLEACQDVVAYYTMLYVAPELNIGFSDMGVVEKGSNQAPVMPVAQWRYKEFKYDLTKKADRLLDRVLSLLEGYVQVPVEEPPVDNYFDLWLESSAYTEFRTTFFHSAEQFSKYVKIDSSRRLFAQLYGDIIRVEEDIKALICDEHFSTLDTAIKEGSLEEEDVLLVEKIRRYVAAKSVHRAAPLLFLTLDGNGLHLSSWSDGYDQTNHLSAATQGAQAVGAFILKQSQDADVYFNDLVSFIHTNIEDYPDIASSDCYEAYTSLGRVPMGTGDGGVMF